MPEHNIITDPNIHEPKGASSAADGTTYISNGSGSGTWERIQGFGQYEDSRVTSGTPAQTISNGVRTKFICNGSGLTLERLPSDATESLWNTTNNDHVPIAANDTYHLLVSFTVDGYAGAAPEITIELDIGDTILEQTVPLVASGAEQSVLFSVPVVTNSTYVSNNGDIYLTYTGTGSVTIFSNKVTIVRTSRDG